MPEKPKIPEDLIVPHSIMYVLLFSFLLSSLLLSHVLLSPMSIVFTLTIGSAGLLTLLFHLLLF